MRLSDHFSLPYLVLAVTLVAIRGASDDGYALCDDCWCILGSGTSCPYDSIPRTNFSDELVNHLLEIKLENPMTLSCDPYYDPECDTVPPLESGKFCAAEIIKNGTQCPNDYSYR